MIKLSRIFLSGMAVVIGISFSACSHKQPQPPVVINLNGTTQTTVQADPSSPQKESPVQDADWKQSSNSVSAAAKDIPEPNMAPPQRQMTDEQTQNTLPLVNQPMIISQKIDEASFFNTQIHDMAVQLMQNFRGDAGPEGPIAVATFVDLNHLYRTSPFGRYIAEQLMGELQRAGFSVVEIRKTDSLLIKERYGEYSLSRNIQEIAKQSSAQYILVGTYVTRGGYILVNARLVSNEGNMIVSSGMKIMRRDPFLERMLWPTATPNTKPGVKVPIKGLGQPTEVRIISGS